MSSLKNHFRLTLIVVSLFLPPLLYGQEDSLVEEDGKYSSASFGLDFMSNNSVNGRFGMFGSQPNLTSMASYYHKWGFDITAMYSNIWKSDETNSKATQELGVSLGYSIDFTKWLSGSASYSQYFYSANSQSLRSVYKRLFSAGVYSEVNWWLADATVGYYSGKANELFVALETGFSIDFDHVLKKGNTLSIEPMVSAYMGDVSYYNSNAYQNYYFMYNFAQQFPEVTLEQFVYRMLNPGTYREKILSERLKRHPKKVESLKRLPNDLAVSELFKAQETFDFNNIGLTVPIYYYWGNFVINVGFSVFRPINQPSYVDAEWSGYTNVGVSYFMSW